MRKFLTEKIDLLKPLMPSGVNYFNLFACSFV